MQACTPPQPPPPHHLYRVKKNTGKKITVVQNKSRMLK